MRKLVDTTVWIEFFRGRETRLPQMLLDDEVAIAPVIIQEILQGIIEDDKYEEVKEQIDAVELIEADPVEAAIGAADIFRLLRKKGLTVRKPNDCLIAWYALYAGYPLYHFDKDFETIAKHTSLKTISRNSK